MSGHQPKRLKLEIALETLRHLGMNLYGSMPPVISELIANAYDARARKVEIVITKASISIEDDGIGMDRAAVQSKYLIVGRDRRLDDPAPSEGQDPFGDWPRREKPMGRKGIGKLAMFSIANKAVVSSIQHGSGVSFWMTRKGIEDAAAGEDGDYHPEELEAPSDLVKGTRIVLSSFRRATPHVSAQLRKSIARRFSIIDLDSPGDENQFQILVDGNPITAKDWDVFSKLQFMWYLGDSSQHYVDRCGNLSNHKRVDSLVDVPRLGSQEISGWVGTVAAPKNLITTVADMKINDNRIVVDCRGKVAVANFLHQFGEAGVYATYLAGYLRADFLDDEDEDIATSDRERMREDDPRVAALSSFVHRLLKTIESEWRDLRIESEDNRAADDPIIGDWLNTLRVDEQKIARRLMGKLAVTRMEERDLRQVQKYAILAFERLRVRDQLDLLRKAPIERIETIAVMFALEGDLEDALYAEVSRQRLSVVRELAALVDTNSKEAVIQRHVYDHLWLVETSWLKQDHVAPRLEERVTTEFGKATLTKGERESRMDIRYRRSGGIHVIVELKMPSVRRDVHQLIRQVLKYKKILAKCLQDVEGVRSPNIQCICLVGSITIDEDAERQLDAARTRIRTYDNVISEAQKQLEDYLEADRKHGRILEIVERLDRKSEEANAAE